MCILCDLTGRDLHNARTINENIDAVASTRTSYTLSVGDVFNGDLDTFGDRDWVEIILSEGFQYKVDLTGSPSGDGTLEDPYLRIYDSGGNLLLENDDIEDGAWDEDGAWNGAWDGDFGDGDIEDGAWDDAWDDARVGRC